MPPTLRPVLVAAIALAFGGVTAAPAAAGVTTSVSGGVLTITQLDDSPTAIYADTSWGISVYTGNTHVEGCSPCTGVTSIHYVGTGGDDDFDGGNAPVPILAEGLGGNDHLTGGTSPDELDGGPGDDWLADGTTGSVADDLYDGGPGTDTVSYVPDIGEFGRAAALTVALAPPGVWSIGNGAPGEDDHLRDIENLTGANGDDVLTGNDEANTIIGGLGTDEIHAAGGDDTVDSRDEVAETVDCGGGTDHVRSDLQLDRATGCEHADPQLFGTPTISGDPQVGVALSVSGGFTALGEPAPTLTYTWNSCGHYSCFPVATTDVFTPTPAMESYPALMNVTVTATNAWGSATLTSNTYRVQPAATPAPTPQPTPTPVSTPKPKVGASGGTGTSAAGDAPFDALAAARRALKGKKTLVPVQSLAVGLLTAYHPTGSLHLPAAGRSRAYLALVCSAGPCTQTVRAVVAFPGTGLAAITLPAQRSTIPSRTARAIGFTATRALLRRVARAHGHARLTITVDAAAKGVPDARATVSVSG